MAVPGNLPEPIVIGSAFDTGILLTIRRARAGVKRIERFFHLARTAAFDAFSHAIALNLWQDGEVKASQKAARRWAKNPRKPAYKKIAGPKYWLDTDETPREPKGGPKRTKP